MTEALETVQRLWDDVETIRSEDYPTDMAPTPTPLVQPGWFPVETGLYASESGQIPSTLPGGGLMVIGHHWGDIAFHSRSAAAPAPLIDPTSRNLENLLRRAGLNLPSQVWRTNVFVGLHREGMMGSIHIAGKDRFVEACRGLLGEQMSQLRPRVCLALGRGPIRMLRTWIGDERWKQFTGFRQLDSSDAAVLRNVRFGAVSTTFIGIVHPCIGANARHQWWRGTCGAATLNALLEFAVAAVNDG
jgi:hypothetical protein